MNQRRVHAYDFRSKREGFTIIELVVAVSIIIILSALIVFNFGATRGTARLRRSAQELSLRLRAAQNAALSTNVFRELRIPGFNRPPSAVGIAFTQGAQTYDYFADRDDRPPCLNASGTKRDYKITGNPACPEKIRTYMLDTDVTIRRILIDGIAVSAGSTRHIIFFAPEAGINFSDTSGGDPLPANRMDIELEAAPSRIQTTITVWASGQITIQ